MNKRRRWKRRAARKRAKDMEAKAGHIFMGGIDLGKVDSMSVTQFDGSKYTHLPIMKFPPDIRKRIMEVEALGMARDLAGLFEPCKHSKLDFNQEDYARLIAGETVNLHATCIACNESLVMVDAKLGDYKPSEHPGESFDFKVAKVD